MADGILGMPKNRRDEALKQMGLEDRIYALMKKNGVSQVSVANALGISAQRLNDILKKRRPMRAEHIVPICVTIGCEPNELFGFEKNHQITITDDDGRVIAAVLGDSVVEHEGYHVILA